MKRIYCILGLLTTICVVSHAGNYTVVSPDRLTTVTVNTDNGLTWSTERQGNQIFAPSHIGLEIEGLKAQPTSAVKVRKASRRSVNETVEAEVPTKQRFIADRYNELTLRLKDGVAVEFRAYDNGVAYRFTLDRPDSVNISDELLRLHMPEGTVAYWPMDRTPDFVTPQESPFERHVLTEVDPSINGYLPIYMQTPAGVRAVLTEADVFDYTNLFVRADAAGSLTGVYPPAIKKARLRPGADRVEDLQEKHPYISRVNGRRALPWRVVMLADNDAALLDNTLPWLLSSPQNIGDTSWLRQGRVLWDWWNDRNVYGVDFEAGINEATYRYCIDFAARHGFEYFLIDEGWSPTTWDITHYKPEVNVEELVKYGRERGVGIILWALWNPIAENLDEIFDTYERWGISGVKIDFMNRADQQMVNFYEAVGKAAAKHHLLIDFHGAYTPSGMQRKYPNIMTFEGVMGSEYNKFGGAVITPTHNLILPFTRNLAGPMDYTPGAVNNVQPNAFLCSVAHPMSIGTRAHQAALYVAFESPLQMISDSPSAYDSAQGYAEFLSLIPTVWDETLGIDAAIGEYMVIARRSGNNWYIAALTDMTPRDITIPTDFLPSGLWEMKSMADGKNAHKQATDNVISTTEIFGGDSINVHLAPGGGWVAVLTPKIMTR